MYCSNCGFFLNDDASFCPNCGRRTEANLNVGNNNNIKNPNQSQNYNRINNGANYNQNYYVNVNHNGPNGLYNNGPVGVSHTQNTQNTNKKNQALVIWAWIFGSIMLFTIIGVAYLIYDWADSKSNSSNNSYKSSQKTNQTTTQATTQAPKATTAPDNIVTTTNFKNMKLKDIGKVDDIYVGLSYVKKMAYLPTALGKSDIKDGCECILAFFDFYNPTDSIKRVYPGDITCYADGTQVQEVETYFKVMCDGIREIGNEDLDGGTQLISVQNFEVPKYWKELKFYYKSACIWTVKIDDVKSSDFTFKSLYTVNKSRTPTNIDHILNDGENEIKYKGCMIYTESSSYSDDKQYALFKFKITNKSSEALSMSLVGYRMRGYINNYYIADGADYSLDDKVDGYINIFDVESIESGMSADVYVAFKLTQNQKKGKLYMIYDDGYIINNYIGAISGEVK